MLELRKVTKAIVPLSKLGGMFGRSLLETVKTKFCSIVSYSHVTKKNETSPRDNMPWEVTQQQTEKYLEQRRTGVVCEDCKPQNILDQFRSILERRRLRKCMEERYFRHKCQDVDMELSITKKCYPFFHASVKKYLPGGPIPGWQELNKPDQYKDLPCC